MNTAIRRTDCTALTTISTEVDRLTSLGYKAAPHVNITQLQPLEYFVHVPPRARTAKNRVSVYYREG